MACPFYDCWDNSAVERMKFKKYILPILTAILFFIPFFWFKPGEMDIGGDSSRLYFYDPLAYMQSQTLYGIISSGVGGETVSYYALPYMLLLAGVKFLVVSPTILIAIFHGISLSAGFLFSYLTVKELARTSNGKEGKYTELSAILAGLFYIFTPTLVLGWDKEILTHNQIFLNPLLFYFLLLFVTRDNIKYLFVALLLSFIFAPNFSLIASPPFFAFYPLAILFLFFYSWIIKKKFISLKKIILGFVLFFLLHLFHLGSPISNLFVGGSQVNENVFSAESKFNRGLSYFTAVSEQVKVSFSFLNLAQLYALTPIAYGFIIFPIIILLGFLWNRKKLYLLTGIFFLITFFFVTANITATGFNFYKKLFDLPGFFMFRNYFGQWVFIFTFFYMLLLGQALETIFERVRGRYIVGTSVAIVSLLLINGWPFINGSLLNKIHFQSKNVKIPSTLDPEYETVLHYIRTLDTDGKFISFPLTDPGYQILMGTNGGAYQGPSTISYLAGRNDFTGYDGLFPFSDTFMTLVKNNDIDGIQRLFAILNIQYVFYNSDPNIYDDTFPKYPYSYVRDKMPENQKEYQAFLAKLPIHKVKDFGEKYHIYEVNEYLPHFYVADKRIYSSDALTPFFVLNLNESLRSVVYTQGNPQREALVILKAVNSNPLQDLVNNYHLHVHDPFVARRMDDVFYPLVSWKEKQTLETLESAPNDYLDYSLLYLSKRVAELNRYGETPITKKTFTEPRLWDISQWGSYYSWEANLARYDKDMRSLMSWVNNASVSDSIKNSMKIKVSENLYQHELRIKRIVNSSKYTDAEKSYLLKKSRSLFVDLQRTLQLPFYNSSEVPYTLDMPEEAFGTYIPYLRSEKDEPLDPAQYTITVNNTTVRPSETASKSSLIAFSPLTITNKKTSILLHYLPQNLLDSGPWVGAGTKENASDETILSIDNQLREGSGFSKRVHDFRAGVQYIITFDYYVEGDDILFSFYEKQKENNKYSSASYFNKILYAKQWQTHQSLYAASPNATDGFVQFLADSPNYKGKLHIKNISVVAVPSDTLFVQKVTDQIEKQHVPTVQFKKINPTRYIVRVSNAKEPYALVFSEAYNDNWKLYLPETELPKEPSVKSYFGGAIREEKHGNTFFEPSFLQNATAISDDSHTRANGYANVWNLGPEAVGGKQDYELIVSYHPQNNFYIFLAISSITAIGIVIALFLLRKKK